MKISKKVILLGFFGVGKTSLIKRFVHQKFDEQYLTTIGVKVDKKVIDVHGVQLSMLIWDIAGESSQQKVPQSYKLGSNGILYVFDVTRPASYETIHDELTALKDLLPNVPIQVVANKIDLLDEKSVFDLKEKIGLENIVSTSAKSGVGVEEAFEKLARAVLK